MNENNATVSQWEWDGIVNDPARKAAADRKVSDESKRRADAEERLCRARERCTERRKKRAVFVGFMYVLAALVSCVIARYAFSGSLTWFGWTMVVAASVFAANACFDFGRACEMQSK